MEQLGDILLLRTYNTRLVVLGTTLLGMACGLAGCFLLLRRRSLMGSALSHAMLPGICLAYMAASALGAQGKPLPWLLSGAALAGLAGCLSVLLIRNLTRIKDDAAMGIVLSGSFGLGVVLLSRIQSMPSGTAAGLDSYIYGKAASMVRDDFLVIAASAAAVLLLCTLLFKEFRLLCFDSGFAASQGWPVAALDIAMLALVTLATVAGLQAVGLILVIAFLVTPAAAARFWTDRLWAMLLLGALIGGASGWLGSVASSLFAHLPAGAVIVLSASFLFLISMLLGTRRGVVRRLAVQLRLKRRIGRQHLLRAAFEWLEARGLAGKPGAPVPIAGLRDSRSWSERALRRRIRSACREGLAMAPVADSLRLTEAGWAAAVRATRNHRLWELYLIRHADIAATHVDRDADAVEHVLGEKLARELETMLAEQADMPRSPHPLQEERHGMGSG